MKDKVNQLRNMLHMNTAKSQNNEINENFDNDNIAPVGDALDNADAAAQDASAPVDTSELDELNAKYAEALKQVQEHKEQFLRTLAEFENFKKRLKKEHEEFTKYANQKILEDIFPVIDSLEMTLSHVKEETDPIAAGVALTLKQFLAALEKYGVKQIAGVGEPFDPNLQEAIGTQKDETLGSGFVVKVLRKGYSLSGKLIRAAMVMVSE